ncbi:hypothetical protein KC328_g6 [Hortaea werneckii]|nr:hypothetical protein KC328_g6 [Hortaea werneckii]
MKIPTDLLEAIEIRKTLLSAPSGNGIKGDRTPRYPPCVILGDKRSWSPGEAGHEWRGHRLRCDVTVTHQHPIDVESRVQKVLVVAVSQRFMLRTPFFIANTPGKAAISSIVCRLYVALRSWGAPGWPAWAPASFARFASSAATSVPSPCLRPRARERPALDGFVVDRAVWCEGRYWGRGQSCHVEAYAARVAVGCAIACALMRNVVRFDWFCEGNEELEGALPLSYMLQTHPRRSRCGVSGATRLEKRVTFAFASQSEPLEAPEVHLIELRTNSPTLLCLRTRHSA